MTTNLEKIAVKAEDIDFDPPSEPWYMAIITWPLNVFVRAVGLPSTSYKLRDESNPDINISRSKSVGIDDPKLVSLLRYHEERFVFFLHRYQVFGGIILLPIGVLALVSYIYFFLSRIDKLPHASSGHSYLPNFIHEASMEWGNWGNAASIALTLMFILAFFFFLIYFAIVFLGVWLKVYFVLFGKRYAPTLCVDSILSVSFFSPPGRRSNQPGS